MSRKEAKTVQGKSCKRGHSGLRYVRKNGKPSTCVECAKAAVAAYETSEKGKARSTARRAANIEKKKAYDSARYAANRDKAKTYHAARYAANSEKIKVYVAAWRAARPEKVRAYKAKYCADRDQRTPKWADLKAIEAVYWVRDQLQAEYGVLYDVDHVIPLRGRLVSGLHVAYNLQILPHVPNMRKHNRFSDTSQEPLDRAHRAARNSIIGMRVEQSNNFPHRTPAVPAISIVQGVRSPRTEEESTWITTKAA